MIQIAVCDDDKADLKHITNAELLLFAKENRNDWFRTLCDNGTITMVQFLKSRYWEISKYEKYTGDWNGKK